MGTLLTTPTYDGSGQATHPSVVLVDATYWMAMTPYPGADNTKENPSILTSADGVTWAVPDGLTNPVVAKPSGGFNSDPDLVYYDGTFHLFYREVAGRERIYLITSADGITWSVPTMLIDLDPAVTRALSPAVIVRGSTWRMWTIDIVPNPNTLELRTGPAAAGPWSAPTVLTLVDPQARDLWHLDVTLDRGLYRMVLMTTTLDTSGGAGRILVGSSAEGLTWLMNGTPLLVPSSGWEASSIYRGTGLRSGDSWRFWYGGVSASNAWRIGYADFTAHDFPAGRGAIPSLAGSMSAWPSLKP